MGLSLKSILTSTIYPYKWDNSICTFTDGFHSYKVSFKISDITINRYSYSLCDVNLSENDSITYKNRSYTHQPVISTLMECIINNKLILSSSFITVMIDEEKDLYFDLMFDCLIDQCKLNRINLINSFIGCDKTIDISEHQIISDFFNKRK